MICTPPGVHILEIEKDVDEKKININTKNKIGVKMLIYE